MFLLPKSNFGIDVLGFESCKSESESLSNWAIIALIFCPSVRILGELSAGEAELALRAERG